MWKCEKESVQKSFFALVFVKIFSYPFRLQYTQKKLTFIEKFYFFVPVFRYNFFLMIVSFVNSFFKRITNRLIEKKIFTHIYSLIPHSHSHSQYPNPMISTYMKQLNNFIRIIKENVLLSPQKILINFYEC